VYYIVLKNDKILCGKNFKTLTFKNEGLKYHVKSPNLPLLKMNVHLNYIYYPARRGLVLKVS
jgi:hypothetical protein